MAFDELLADRIRYAIEPISTEFTERKMFGGLSFLYWGKMSIGIVKDELCVRFIENKYPDLLQKEHIRPMDFTGRAMKEMAFVAPEAFQNDEELMTWIKIGIEHAQSKL